MRRRQFFKALALVAWPGLPLFTRVRTVEKAVAAQINPGSVTYTDSNSTTDLTSLYDGDPAAGGVSYNP